MLLAFRIKGPLKSPLPASASSVPSANQPASVLLQTEANGACFTLPWMLTIPDGSHPGQVPLRAPNSSSPISSTPQEVLLHHTLPQCQACTRLLTTISLSVTLWSRLETNL